MATVKDPIVELMTQRAEEVSADIQATLHGLGVRTQGAILADLVSLWLAGHFAQSEVGRGGPLTASVRAEAFKDFAKLVFDLVPASEMEFLQNVEPEGRG